MGTNQLFKVLYTHKLSLNVNNLTNRVFIKPAGLVKKIEVVVIRLTNKEVFITYRYLQFIKRLIILPA